MTTSGQRHQPSATVSPLPSRGPELCPGPQPGSWGLLLLLAIPVFLRIPTPRYSDAWLKLRTLYTKLSLFK